MENSDNTAGRVAAPTPGSLVKVRLKFRAVEYHTIEREVPIEEIESRDDGDLFDWLHKEFVDDGMSDSDYYTETFELDHFETLPDPENTQISNSGA